MSLTVVAVAAVVVAWLRPLVGTTVAAGCGVLLLFLGAAGESLFWGFRIGFVGSTAAGLGALLAAVRLERGGRWWVLVLTTIAVSCSNVGVPFALATAVALVARRTFRGLWTPLLPLSAWVCGS